MITGYNTDVRHQDVVFHVQTEDKGTDNPFIESLVYVGGQVLAAKRASYANLLANGTHDKAVVELMERQHRTVIAAIKNGRFDEKLAARMGAKEATAASADATSQAVSPTRTSEVAIPDDLPRAAPKEPEAEPLTERTLDQVILEYLTNEADQEQLLLTVDSDDQFVLGAPAELALRTTSSKSGQPVTGARVQVRMISTIADPRVLASGETDGEGELALSFQIPSLDRGTAALIISAASAVGNAEIKHLL
jgi:hypothetical protein